MLKFINGEYIELTETEIDELALNENSIDALQSEIEKLQEKLEELKGGNDDD
jgi:cob(I)alamin adenosyltransferase